MVIGFWLCCFTENCLLKVLCLASPVYCIPWAMGIVKMSSILIGNVYNNIIMIDRKKWLIIHQNVLLLWSNSLSFLFDSGSKLNW